jgi:membrane protease YdiL (CAAX protease family)
MTDTAVTREALPGESASFEAKLSRAHVWPVVPLMLGTYIAAIVFTPRSLGTTEAALIKECATVAVVVAWWLWVVARRAPSVRSALGPPLDRRKWGWVLFCAASLLLARSGLLLLVDFLRGLGVEPVVPYAYAEPNDAASVVAGTLTTCFLLPVAEELAFRSGLFRGWRARLGGVWAALASSALFALFHSDPLGSFLSAFAWVLLYVRTGTLWAPVVAHCLNNLFAAAWLLGLGAWSREVVAGEARQVVALVLSVVGAGGLVALARASWPGLSAPLPPDAPAVAEPATSQAA